mmetsp:Transcript_81922/g.236900  ORF Transcript_81922/g.236900 Transcript_81922/m.236900 type:complete len:343 (+) Transcript_81922:226-1254(+)
MHCALHGAGGGPPWSVRDRPLHAGLVALLRAGRLRRGGGGRHAGEARPQVGPRLRCGVGVCVPPACAVSPPGPGAVGGTNGLAAGLLPGDPGGGAAERFGGDCRRLPPPLRLRTGRVLQAAAVGGRRLVPPARVLPVGGPCGRRRRLSHPADVVDLAAGRVHQHPVRRVGGGPGRGERERVDRHAARSDRAAAAAGPRRHSGRPLDCRDVGGLAAHGGPGRSDLQPACPHQRRQPRGPRQDADTRRGRRRVDGLRPFPAGARRVHDAAPLLQQLRPEPLPGPLRAGPRLDPPQPLGRVQFRPAHVQQHSRRGPEAAHRPQLGFQHPGGPARLLRCGGQDVQG